MEKCPHCGAPLSDEGRAAFFCDACDREFESTGGASSDSVGGIVTSVRVSDAEVTVGTRERVRPGDSETAVVLPLSDTTAQITVGDSLWWQSGEAYWTPRDGSRPETPIPRISSSFEIPGAADATVDRQAHEAATSQLNDKPEPTDAQKESGAYPKGHITVGPLNIAIENPSGSRRRPEWPPLSDHYGYIKGTTGFDKDHLDVFVKAGTDEDWNGPVWVVNQFAGPVANGSGFDEHKCMVGWEDADAALGGYLSNYTADQKANVHSVVGLPFDRFATWATGEDGPSAGLLLPQDDYPVLYVSGAPPPTDEQIRFQEAGRNNRQALDDFHRGVKEAIAQGDSVEAFADEVAADAEILAFGDAVTDGLMRVRQKASRADAENLNGRVLPRALLERAIDAERARARAGAMLSDFRHPQIVQKCDLGARCQDAYVDEPDNRTARVDEISAVDPDGWVYVTRTILDTPRGREVAKRIREKRPYGISMRYFGEYDQRPGGPKVFRLLRISTFDDVENPAVIGAGGLALGDSQIHPGAASADSQAFATATTDAPEPGETSTTTMNRKQAALAAIRTFRSAARPGACGDEVKALDTAAADAVRAAYLDGHDASDIRELMGSYKAATDSATNAGYNAGEDSPFAVLAGELGSDPSSGYAPDVTGGHGSGTNRLLQPNVATAARALGDGEESDEDKAEREKKVKEAAEKARTDSVNSALASVMADPSHPFHKLPEGVRQSTVTLVSRSANGTEAATAMIDHAVETASQIGADATLVARGLRGAATADPAGFGSQAVVVRENIPGMAVAMKLQGAADDIARRTALNVDFIADPNDPTVQKERKRNLERAMPLIEDIMAHKLKSDGGAYGDACQDESSFLMGMARGMKGMADSVTTTTSFVYNQPTIALWMLLQQFQDLRMFEFVEGMGPGQEAGGSMPGWEQRTGFGRVLRVPSLSYQNPPGFGFQNGNVDLGLINPNPGTTGIDEGTPVLAWQTFAPIWRYIATSIDWQTMKAIGNGPLNLSLVAQALWMMGARKSRTIDSALANEVMDVALEYQATAVTNEQYTTGNSGLPNNSVFASAGPITVNLMATKTAAASVQATDRYKTYGAGATITQVDNTTVTGAAPVAALRLKGGNVGVTQGSTSYYGSKDTLGGDPIVRPRAKADITAAGADTSTTLNPFSISAPGGMVLGILGNDGNVWPAVPGQTPTYAVDWLSGVVVFTAAAGLAGSGGVITTSITVSYSYSTNYDTFNLGLSNPGQLSLNGQSYATYYNGLVGQIDTTSAKMGSGSNFVFPNLGMMSMNVAAALLQASVFYQLNSPKETELFPNEKVFAQRNGVGLARLNTPTFWGDDAAVFTRRGATKYAVDTPFEIRGPLPAYDSSGRVQGGEKYAGFEGSAICTPLPIDRSGRTLNCTNRAILLR